MKTLSKQVPAAMMLADRMVAGRRRRRARARAAQAGWLGLGLAIGSGIGLLLAPARGKVTRRRLRAGVDQAKAYVLRTAAQAEDVFDSRTH